MDSPETRSVPCQSIVTPATHTHDSLNREHRISHKQGLLTALHRKIVGILAAVSVCICILIAVGYTEYRTNYGARLLGSYLADINITRPSTGRLWELISSEQQARIVLPDSAAVPPRLPSDLPPLVQSFRLSTDRIPEDGLPGYLAILVEPIPEDRRGAADAPRLIEGSHLHRLGRTIIARATFDPTPFVPEVKRAAAALGKSIDLTESDATHRSTVADTASSRDSIRALSDDVISTSVVETFTAVLLEERLARFSLTLTAHWDKGRIHQLFINRALGDYQGEIYYASSNSPSVNFRITIDDLSEIVGVPVATGAP